MRCKKLHFLRSFLTALTLIGTTTLQAQNIVCKSIQELKESY